MSEQAFKHLSRQLQTNTALIPSAPDKFFLNQYRTGQIWSQSVLAQIGILESVSTLLMTW